MHRTNSEHVMVIFRRIIGFDRIISFILHSTNCFYKLKQAEHFFKHPISLIMAKINQGILGPVNGPIGPITTYNRKGQTIARTRRSRGKHKRTPKRTNQQEKLKICNRFTKLFSGTGFFDKAFSAYGKTNYGYNRVTSALMNQAVVGTYPDLQLSYPKVLISQGMLPGAENAAAVADENGNIHFSFKDNSDTGTASGVDTVIAVAYCEALKQKVFSLNAGLRKDGEAVLNASEFKGYEVETWIGFLSNDEMNASDSVWTGRVSL